MEPILENDKCEKFDWKKLIDPFNIIPAAISIILWIVAHYIPLKPLYVPPNDSQSMFPKVEKSTVSNNLVTILIFAVSIIFFIIFYIITIKFPHCKYISHFSPFTALYALVTAVCLTGFFTNVLKFYVGRPRPDMYAWCNSTTAQYETCTNISKSKQQGEFVSWPSGHSSNSMSGGIFICLFLQKLLRIRKLWWTLICSLFIFAAVFVACSRVVDYRHHPDDIVAGMFLGFLITIFVWQRSYKSIFFKSKEKYIE